MNTQKYAGFTFVELLMVLIILGVLMGVLVPRLANARNVAQNTAAEIFTAHVIKWLAAAEASNQTVAPGLLSGDCLNPKLRGEGAPGTLPASVSSCSITYFNATYTVVVNSVTGKGGPNNNGVFTASY